MAEGETKTNRDLLATLSRRDSLERTRFLTTQIFTTKSAVPAPLFSTLALFDVGGK